MKRASGFTLAELMLVVALLGLVVGATMTVLVRQQQFYRSAGQISGVREQLRQAIGAITTDLRGVSPLDGDFYAISDKSVEFRAVTGSAIICQITSATQFLIPPQQLGNGNTLTFINEFGGISAGYIQDSSHVVATGWGNLVGTLVPTAQGVRINWANGTAWDQVRPGG